MEALDLADEAAIRRVGLAVRAALGRLDVWINNAGADILTGPGAVLSTVREARPASGRGPARHDPRFLGSRARLLAEQAEGASSST